MRDSGSAIALMGNHEFNMLSFWYKNGDGGRFLKNPGRGYLRKHTLNQIKGHLKTIETFAGYEDEFEEVKDFAKTLPFYLETPNELDGYKQEIHTVLQWLGEA